MNRKVFAREWLAFLVCLSCGLAVGILAATNGARDWPQGIFVVTAFLFLARQVVRLTVWSVRTLGKP